MRWVFLSLVLINTMFFSWRYFLAPHEPAEAAASAVPPKASEFASIDTLPESSSIKLLEEINSSTEPVASTVEVDELEVKGLPQSQALLAEGAGQALNHGAMCYWAGPLGTDVQRDLLLKRLKGLRIDASEHVSRSAGDQRHWVYLPPFASRAEAKRQLAALQKLDLDSYLILKGERRHGISLGLYSRAALARRKMEEVRAAGWEPAVDVFAQTISQRWIAASKRQVDEVGEGILARMLKNKSSVTIIEKKCELPVASHNNIH